MNHDVMGGRRLLVRLQIGGLGLVAAALVIMSLALLVRGCPASDEQALSTLHERGYRAVKLGDAAGWKCPNDSFSRTFVATSPSGREVSGTVCCQGVYGCGSGGCYVRINPEGRR